MTLPFNKVAVITDLHFGRNGNNPVANQDNLDFLDWFIEQAKTWGADRIAVMGDWHDSRYSIQLGTLDSSLAGMEKLSAAFKVVDFITGNHDLMYRDSRSVASTIFAKNVPNINFINDPLTIGEGKESITYLPWLVGDERKLAKQIKSRYVFSHLELPHFMMNAKVPMPAHDKGITVDDFGHPEFVFSGHFHFRQTQKNVVYTGNIMPFNFADDWDTDRGCMFLEWGKDPVFHAWPDQPLFRTMKLSELIANPGKMLKAKLTARVSMDVDINFEQSQFIKDELAKEYNVRRLELIAAKSEGVASEEGEDAMRDVVFQTVDQIVFEGLNALDSDVFDSATLRSIYVDCTETTKR
jgi:DNA repair exonuclease SbcCD nuclease subunit